MAKRVKKPPKNCTGARLRVSVFGNQKKWDAATKRCNEEYDCGNNCDAWFADTLMREQCYAYCKTSPDLSFTKEEFIENVIGCENFYTRTGTLPPCKGFNVEEDTAQGQAFVAETQAAAAYNTAQIQQQEMQQKLMIILGVVIIGLLAFLFIPSNKKM